MRSIQVRLLSFLNLLVPKTEPGTYFRTVAIPIVMVMFNLPPSHMLATAIETPGVMVAGSTRP